VEFDLSVPQTLLQRVAVGDPAAIDECIRQFGPLIWSLARRFFPKHADAEDAAQDIFIDLWEKAPRYDPAIAAEQTFVAMIARRRLIDRKRRLSRGPGVSTLEDNDFAVGRAMPTPDAVALNEEAAGVRRAVASLEPDQQKLIQLSILNGWSHGKIAEHLRLPLGTVKTRLRRAILTVREVLGAGRSPDSAEVAR
jgi:RNA polymerase sigma-70 factor (ECF subfamily)